MTEARRNKVQKVMAQHQNPSRQNFLAVCSAVNVDQPPPIEGRGVGSVNVTGVAGTRERLLAGN